MRGTDRGRERNEREKEWRKGDYKKHGYRTEIIKKDMDGRGINEGDRERKGEWLREKGRW